MKEVKYSLKFKILSAVVGLLSVCTLFSLVYSYRLFIEDKTSYIYETGLKKAENISDQISFGIEDVKTKNEFNSVLINTPSINFEKLLNNQSNIVVSGLFDLSSGRPVLAKHFFHTKNINLLSSTFGISTSTILDEVTSKITNQNPFVNYWIFSPNKGIKLLVYITKNNANNSLLFSVSNLGSLLEIFTKDKTFKNKLISLTSNDDLKDNSELLKLLDYEKSKKGVLSVFESGQELLVSYSFITKNLLVTSSINRSSAFGITQFLILKTVLFAGFLIGIAAIMGIYFSSSITHPLTLLTGKAKELASGVFSDDIKINTSDEISILGSSFNFMSKEIQGLLKNKEELIGKLEDYSKNLEMMVEKRTLELKEANDFMALMVNSLDQGLLVFDSELNCNPMFTKACEPMFGVSPLNKSLPEVLSIADDEQIQNLKQWATITFNELIPFDSAINLGPREKTFGVGFSDPNYKFVKIDYYPMRDIDEKITNIVLIATDKTNEVQATERAREKELYVSMILKILNNKMQFESFIGEVDDILNQFSTAYSEEDGTINFELCMMLFHTINGGFGIYSLTNLQALARVYETEIVNIKDNCPDPVEYISFIKENVSNIRQEFHKFKVEFDQLIGTKFSTNQSYVEVSREKIISLKPLVYSTHSEELIKIFDEDFLKTEIYNYFKAYDDLCKTTAVKINKEFKGLTFSNEHLKIEVEPFLEFFNVLVHLFRNCLDHGLEDSYKRQELGKSPDGHISVSFNLVDGANLKFFEITIEDDGAGIDPKIIRSRYTKLRPDEDVSHLSNQEIIYKIFDPFFSTRDEVSALSGRGVGMSAIKEVVDRLNGTIEIESHVGLGSTFTFLLPIT